MAAFLMTSVVKHDPAALTAADICGWASGRLSWHPDGTPPPSWDAFSPGSLAIVDGSPLCDGEMRLHLLLQPGGLDVQVIDASGDIVGVAQIDLFGGKLSIRAWGPGSVDGEPDAVVPVAEDWEKHQSNARGD